MAARKKIVPVDHLSEDEVASLVLKIETAGAILVKGAFSVPLSKTGETLVREALAKRGIEWAGRFLRLPLETQLTRHLAAGGSLDVAKLPKLLLGGFRKPDIDHVLREGVKIGRLVLVREGKKTRVENASQKVLSETELKSLRDQVAKITTLLKTVQPKRGALPTTLDRSLFSDLINVVNTLAEPMRKHSSQSIESVSNNSASVAEKIVQELISRRDSQTGEVQIVDLVSSLNAVGIQTSDIHRILLDFSSQGRVELRPDSGFGLLTDEQRALCLRGPHGSTLSAARWLGSNHLGFLIHHEQPRF